MVSAVGTTTILPIADRSPARAIPLQNAYSDRVDQYDTISVHTAISSQNEQSVQNGAISPRILTSDFIVTSGASCCSQAIALVQ